MKVYKIANNYLENDYIKLPISLGVVSNLLISTNEIIYLNIGNKILINKTSSCMNIDNYRYDIEGYRYVNFKYNENYLFVQNNQDGQRVIQFYFTKENNETLCFINSMYSIDNEVGELKINILNRNEIENIFDKDKYDAMYILDVNGKMFFASNKKDKQVISKKIIPSDKEIIDMEYEDKKFGQEFARMFFKSVGEKFEDELVSKKKIEDIKNVKIYSSIIMPFAHILVISKNNKFKVYEFSLDFVCKDTFKLKSREVMFKTYPFKEIKELDGYLTEEDIKKLIK